MAKIVSEKIWVHVARIEIEQWLQNMVPEGYGDFELTDIAPVQVDHLIGHATFELRIKSPPLGETAELVSTDETGTPTEFIDSGPEEGGEDVFGLPSHCTRCYNRRHVKFGLIVDEGLHKCPACGTSYGPVEDDE